jgi:hypothetical protein
VAEEIFDRATGCKSDSLQDADVGSGLIVFVPANGFAGASDMPGQFFLGEPGRHAGGTDEGAYVRHRGRRLDGRPGKETVGRPFENGLAGKRPGPENTRTGADALEHRLAAV